MDEADKNENKSFLGAAPPSGGVARPPSGSSGAKSSGAKSSKMSGLIIALIVVACVLFGTGVLYALYRLILSMFKKNK